jgi:thermolysin
MPTRRTGRLVSVCACVAAALVLGPTARPTAQHRQTTITTGKSLSDLRAWSRETDSMLRSRELRVRSERADELIPGRTIQRADQYYRGVRVFGADVARQIDKGQIVSVFGSLYPDITVDTTARLSRDDARAAIVGLAGREQGDDRHPELIVLPLDDGSFRLVWRMEALTAGPDLIQYFVDASTGKVVLQYSNRQTQSAVGRATGVLGDSKKISVSRDGSRYTADDLLRPPLIMTFDMKGSPTHTDRFLSGLVPLFPGDLASDDDNVWTDGAVDDAHVYAGYTYDFYYKRFGRHGLNDNNIRILNLVHPVRRDQLVTLFDKYPDYFLNAFYAGGGVMVYGEGLPDGYVLSDTHQTVDYFAGALDIVAHELTHGVTEFTSGLIYRNESGALNEAFSDMMGTSAEFFFQPAGSGLEHADYLIGEDVFRPGGTRSMADPRKFGDPDNYSIRFKGTADNGGVHTNSGIANNAFYLAIEGGTNRTSGRAVQGVGAANREQIEKVFYRAFTELLPSNATFSVARAACIQAARDLYGGGSPAERAVTDAWTAVGVK